MRKFWKIFLRSLATYFGQQGGLSQPLVIVGFNQMVILITDGMRYFAMESISLVCILAKKLTSVPMCHPLFFLPLSKCSLHEKVHFLHQLSFFKLRAMATYRLTFCLPRKK